MFKGQPSTIDSIGPGQPGVINYPNPEQANTDQEEESGYPYSRGDSPVVESELDRSGEKYEEWQKIINKKLAEHDLGDMENIDRLKTALINEKRKPTSEQNEKYLQELEWILSLYNQVQAVREKFNLEHDSIGVKRQALQQQLQNRLISLLKELNLKHIDDLLQEIANVDLQKNMVRQYASIASMLPVVNSMETRIKKLEEAHALYQEIEKLTVEINKEKQPESPQAQKLHRSQLRLDELLRELGLKSIEELLQEIEGIEQQKVLVAQYRRNPGMASVVNTIETRINKVEEAHALYQEIEKLTVEINKEKQPESPQAQKLHRSQLRLDELLRELGLKSIEELLQEIEGIEQQKVLVAQYRRNPGMASVVNTIETRINKLEEAHALYQEIEKLTVEINKERQPESPQAQKLHRSQLRLDELLRELGLKSIEELLQEVEGIEQQRVLVAQYKRNPGMASVVNAIETRISKLEEAHALYQVIQSSKVMDLSLQSKFPIEKIETQDINNNNTNTPIKVTQVATVATTEILQSANTGIQPATELNKQVNVKQTMLIAKLEALSTIPLSAQKLAGQLCAYAQLKAGGLEAVEVNNAYILLDKDLFLSHFLKLEERLKKEGLSTFFMGICLSEADKFLHSSNWKDFQHKIKTVLEDIEPFSLMDLKYLIAEGDAATQSVKDQDIVLLLGNTGTGKSTTIHFLAGSELKKDEGKNYIRPGRIKNPALKKVVTGEDVGNSQTRFISAVPINCEDMGRASKDHLVQGRFTLCDAPGFGDLGGSEVDVANSINVVNAIKKCQSVKLFTLLSQRSMGNRGEGLRELVHFLCNMVPDAPRHLRSFIYGFTMYTKKKDEKEIIDFFEKILTSERDRQYKDNNFLAILNDIVTKIQKGPWIRVRIKV